LTSNQLVPQEPVSSPGWRSWQESGSTLLLQKQVDASSSAWVCLLSNGLAQRWTGWSYVGFTLVDLGKGNPGTVCAFVLVSLGQVEKQVQGANNTNNLFPGTVGML